MLETDQEQITSEWLNDRFCVLANILHALSWESFSYLESGMRAFRDWACEELLD
ncbi:hypothetical protein ACFLXI_04995 [Chloroflexota bacterium]